jgi:hypothetical protein
VHGNKKCREKKGRRYKVSEQDKSFFDRLLSSDGYSEEDKVREYISHRIRNGANLREVLQEEYVLRNTTQTEREEIVRDPRVVQQSREGLKQYFESEELAPEHPTAAAKGQSSEGPRREEPLTDVDGGRIGPPATGA